MTMLFKMGQVFCTIGVANRVENDKEFENFVHDSIYRHSTGDWGEMDDEDKATNNEALSLGNRLFSAYTYKKDKTKIWVITEADRSSTTVLFPDEY